MGPSTGWLSNLIKEQLDPWSSSPRLSVWATLLSSSQLKMECVFSGEFEPERFYVERAGPLLLSTTQLRECSSQSHTSIQADWAIVLRGTGSVQEKILQVVCFGSPQESGWVLLGGCFPCK